MTSTHAYVAEEDFERRLMDDPAAVGAALARAKETYSLERVPECVRYERTTYRDALGSSARALSPAQLYVWDGNVAVVGIGNVLFTACSVGSGPAADAERAANALVLSKLRHPCDAWVDMEQGNADQDGFFAWSEMISMRRVIPPPPERDDDTLSWREQGGSWDVEDVGPFRVPLEIGDCLPSRVWMYLVQSGGVARWPYGSEWIWLFRTRGMMGIGL